MWPRHSHSPSTRAVRWPSPACWLGPREGFAAECPVQAVVSAAAGAYAAAAVSLFTLGLLAMESHVRPAWRHGHFPVHDVEGSTRRWEQCRGAEVRTAEGQSRRALGCRLLLYKTKHMIHH